MRVRSPDPATVRVARTSVDEASVRITVEAVPEVVILALSMPASSTVAAELLVVIVCASADPVVAAAE